MCKTKPLENAKRKARIALVDDHPIVREGVASLINGQSDMTICAEAEEAGEALKTILSSQPDMAIIDISLKKGNGISLIKEVLARRAGLPILVLTMHDEPVYAERALKAGATGYVTKQEEPSMLLEAIRRLLDGGAYVSEKLASAMLLGIMGSGNREATGVLDVLSDREFEVFHMIARGLGTREIAQQLSRSRKTIEAHRENIKKKLSLKSAADLARYALQWSQSHGDA